MDLGRFFGHEFGSLEVDFSMIFGSFTETTGNNTTPQDKQHMVGERSERASAASEASGAIEAFERLFFRIFGGIHGNHRKEHDIAGETKITNRASRSLT